MMRSTLNIPGRLRKTVDSELQTRETIRWIEQPVPRFFTPASIGSFLFGIPWTSFALFWIWGASGFELPDFREGFQPFDLFPLFGIPFVWIGLGMLSSPIWAWRDARNTVYLITDQRAISIQGGRTTTIKSYFPNELEQIYRREHSNGSGDVMFSNRYWQDSDGDQRREEVGFLRIQNPRDIESLLKQLAQTTEK